MVTVARHVAPWSVPARNRRALATRMVCSRAVSATRLSASRSGRLSVRLWRTRNCMTVAGVAASLAMTACGSGARQDAHEPSATFKISIVSATFPAKQRVAEQARLAISIRNSGAKTIPDLAVTICNVCS